MKRILTSVIAVFMLLSLVSCSLDGDVSSTEPTDKDTDTEVDETTVKSVETDEQCTAQLWKGFNSIEKYEEYLEATPQRDDFVHYDDIAFLGNFVCFYAHTSDSQLSYYYKIENDGLKYDIYVNHGYESHKDFESYFQPMTEPTDDDIRCYWSSDAEADGRSLKYVISGNNCDIMYYYATAYQESPYFERDKWVTADGMTYYYLWNVVWVCNGTEVVISPETIVGMENKSFMSGNLQKLTNKSTADEVVSQIIENVEQ